MRILEGGEGGKEKGKKQLFFPLFKQVLRFAVLASGQLFFSFLPLENHQRYISHADTLDVDTERVYDF